MRASYGIALLLVACTTGMNPCENEGQSRCQGNRFEVCADAHWTLGTTCPDACDPEHGCLTCTPSSAHCEDGVSYVCAHDGSGQERFECDPALGLSCGDNGRCQGPCAPDQLGRSYLGCEFYPVTMGSSVRTNLPFGIAVANYGEVEAWLTIDGGELSAERSAQVPPHASLSIELPWVESLKLCVTTSADEIECLPSQSSDESGPAYRVRSTSPIAVYQFSPLHYVTGGVYGAALAYSADASLLLPANAWGTDYVVAAHEIFRFGNAPMPSELVIIAAHDDTHVTITANADTGSLVRGVPSEVVLDRGQAFEPLSYTGDLTGTRVQASAPVEVLGGHFITRIPAGTEAADHLEESMLPIDALGREYVVAPPALAVPGYEAGALEEVRIVAAEPNITLELDPPIEGALTHLSSIGAAVSLGISDHPIYIHASGRILVSQYMLSGMTYVSGAHDRYAPDAGDPAMTIAAPLDQARLEYIFHAPPDFQDNFVTVIWPEGASVELDGAALEGPTHEVGSTSWRVTHVRLPDGGTGSHRLVADQRVGLQVYGYGAWTSYWYPGGLDADVLIF